MLTRKASLLYVSLEEFRLPRMLHITEIRSFIANLNHDPVNPLKLNDFCRGRTAQLTSKRFILYIYSTNIDSEYFKHVIYSPFFFVFKMQFVS